MKNRTYKVIVKYVLVVFIVLFVILVPQNIKIVNKVYASNTDQTCNEKKEYNEYDQKAFQIVNLSGMWTEKVNQLIPKMTSNGVERIVSLYMKRNGGNEFAFQNTKNAINYIKTAVDKKFLNNQNTYYDLVANEWYERTKDIYLVMMLFPNMSAKKVEELVFNYTNETKRFFCVYKSLDYLSSAGLDKIILNYIEKTKDYETVISAVNYMTEEGQKEFYELCPYEVSTILEIQEQNDEYIMNKNIKELTGEPVVTDEDYSKFNESDKQAYNIILYCGMWNDEITQLLPNMSSFGVEKMVSLYLFKSRNFSIAKKAFKFVDNKVDKNILKLDSKKYYDLVADEWYNRTKDMYLVMMIVPDMSTKKVDQLIFDYIKETNNLHSIYSIINFMSPAGVDKAVLYYVNVTGNYDGALATIDFMSEDGRNEFLTLYKNY